MARLVTLGACIVVLSASAARAETVRAGEVMRVERRVDPAAFTQTFTAHYNVALRHVVVADIDLDGDVDVVAATDDQLSVWLNDGTGRLTSQPSTQVPLPALQARGTAWDRHSSRDQESIQNDAPMPRLTVARVPVPLVASVGALHSPSDPCPSACLPGASSPRAPPATL